MPREPRRSGRITPTGSGRIPPLFSPAMDNSAVANPGRRARSPSPRKGTPRGKNSRRRLELDASGSPNRSNDGSSARTPCTGGGDRRPNVEDRPVEDGPDNNDNSDEFIDPLKASDDPMMHKFAAYLSAKDKAKGLMPNVPASGGGAPTPLDSGHRPVPPIQAGLAGKTQALRLAYQGSAGNAYRMDFSRHRS